MRKFSARDAERLPAYFKMLDAAVGRRFRKLDASVQRDIHEQFTRSAGDLLDHWFETDAVKALYGFDAEVGSYASPKC